VSVGAAIELVVAGPLGFLFLPDVGAISDQNGTLATPAGYAFAIWGPIFLLLGMYAVWQALPAQRTNRLLRRVGWPLAAACLGNAVWEVVFPQRQFVLAQIIIVAIFGALAVAFGRLAGEARERGLSGRERWLVALPLGMLFGWLTAATLAGFAVTARGIDVLPTGTREIIVAVGLVAICGGIASLVLLRGAAVPAQGLLPYAGAVIWALVAIVAAGGQEATAIAVGAGAMIVAVLIAALGAVLGGQSGGLRGSRRIGAAGVAGD
jgi:hypothetical protein